jgi:hypothetical protein
MKATLNGASIRSELMQKIEIYLIKNKVSATRFGYMSTGDPSLITKLRNGGDIRLQTLEKIMQFMMDQKK